MKFKVDRQTLGGIVSTLEKAMSASSSVSSSTLTPKEFLLEAKEGMASAWNTNFSVGVHSRVKADVESEGSAIISLAPFSNFLRLAPGEEVSIEKAGNHVRATCGGYESELTIRATEVPPVPEEMGEGLVSLSLEDIRRIERMVAFTANPNMALPVLTGVQFLLQDGKFSFTALDMVRCSRLTLETDGENLSAVIPVRNLEAITKAVESVGEEEISLSYSGGRLFFWGEMITAFSLTLAGEFPNAPSYLQVTSQHLKIECRRKELLEATVIVGSATTERDMVVEFSLKDETLTLESKRSDVARNRGAVRASASAPLGMKISLQMGFLRDVLSALECETVELYFKSETEPLIVKDPDIPGFSHIILPVLSR
jgi:DNA polymerase III sliding clamp (beta) subunit (PCNA family)